MTRGFRFVRRRLFLYRRKKRNNPGERIKKIGDRDLDMQMRAAAAAAAYANEGGGGGGDGGVCK